MSAPSTSARRPRRARRWAVVLAWLLAVAACGGSAPRGSPSIGTVGPGSSSPEDSAPPMASTPGTIVAPFTGPELIPDDPYAPEPVVQIGTMEVPKLHLVHTIFDGVTLHNIDRGPSHWPGTAMPGQPGNTVFAGHRSSHDEPFRNIDRLANGDLVIFTVQGVRTTYRVTGNLVVTPKDIWIADQTPDATGTLYACDPPGSAARRLVVRLALVTGDTGDSAPPHPTA